MYLEKLYIMFLNLASNELFIALTSVWFGQCINTIYTKYKNFTQNIEAKIFFIQNCIFTIEQNYTWINNIKCSTQLFDKYLINVKHLSLKELSYTSTIDKTVIQILHIYEEQLCYIIMNISINNILAKESYDTHNFNNSTTIALTSLNTVLEVYQRQLNYPFTSYLLDIFGVNERIAIPLQNSLSALVLERQNRMQKPENKVEEQ